MTFHVLEYDPLQQVPWFFLIEYEILWNMMTTSWHIYIYIYILNLQHESLWFSMNLTRPGLEQPQGPSRGPGSTLPAPSSAAAVAGRSSRPATTRRWGPENHAENHGKTTTFSWFKWAFKGVYWVYRTSWTHPYLWYYLLIIREIHLCNLFWQTLEIECFVASEILLRNSAEIGFEGPLRGQIPRSC